jgi:hypothetical protein
MNSRNSPISSRPRTERIAEATQSLLSKEVETRSMVLTVALEEDTGCPMEVILTAVIWKITLITLDQSLPPIKCLVQISLPQAKILRATKRVVEK